MLPFHSKVITSRDTTYNPRGRWRGGRPYYHRNRSNYRNNLIQTVGIFSEGVQYPPPNKINYHNNTAATIEILSEDVRKPSMNKANRAAERGHRNKVLRTVEIQAEDRQQSPPNEVVQPVQAPARRDSPPVAAEPEANAELEQDADSDVEIIEQRTEIYQISDDDDSDVDETAAEDNADQRVEPAASPEVLPEAVAQECLGKPSEVDAPHAASPSRYVAPPPTHVALPPPYVSPLPPHVASPPLHVASSPPLVASPSRYVGPPPTYVAFPPPYVSPPPPHVASPPLHVAPSPPYVASPEPFHHPDIQPSLRPEEILDAMPRDVLDTMLATMAELHQRGQHPTNNNAIDAVAERANLHTGTEPEPRQHLNGDPAPAQLIRRLENDFELVHVGRDGGSYTGAMCNFCGYMIENGILSRRVLNEHRIMCQRLPIELVTTTTQRVTRHDIDTVTSTQPIRPCIVQCFMCGMHSDRPHFDLHASRARYSREPIADVLWPILAPEYSTPVESDQVCSECFTLINQFDSAVLTVVSVRNKIEEKLAERRSMASAGHETADDA